MDEKEKDVEKSISEWKKTLEKTIEESRAETERNQEKLRRAELVYKILTHGKLGEKELAEFKPVEKIEPEIVVRKEKRRKRGFKRKVGSEFQTLLAFQVLGESTNPEVHKWLKKEFEKYRRERKRLIYGRIQNLLRKGYLERTFSPHSRNQKYQITPEGLKKLIQLRLIETQTQEKGVKNIPMSGEASIDPVTNKPMVTIWEIIPGGGERKTELTPESVESWIRKDETKSWIADTVEFTEYGPEIINKEEKQHVITLGRMKCGIYLDEPDRWKDAVGMYMSELLLCAKYHFRNIFSDELKKCTGVFFNLNKKREIKRYIRDHDIMLTIMRLKRKNRKATIKRILSKLKDAFDEYKPMSLKQTYQDLTRMCRAGHIIRIADREPNYALAEDGKALTKAYRSKVSEFH